MRGAAERERRAARGPGGVGGSPGRWGLHSAEFAAAALALRQQKAPESDSNFCQTHQRTWPPGHVARSAEPSSRPPRPFLSPQGSLKGPVASAGSSAPRGLKFFATNLQGQTQGRHTAAPTRCQSQTNLELWHAPVPSLSSPISLIWSCVPLLPPRNTQNRKGLPRALSALKSKSLGSEPHRAQTARSHNLGEPVRTEGALE